MRIDPAECRFTFENEGWYPGIGYSTEMFLEKIEADFNKALSNYLKRIKALASERGVKILPFRRGRASQPLDRIEWLVRRRVQGWEIKDIVEKYFKATPDTKYFLDDSQVSRSNTELARILELPLSAP